MSKRKTNWEYFIVGIIPSIIVSALLVGSLDFFKNKYDRYILDNAPTSEFFEYKSVEFVKRDGDILVFESNSIVRRSYPTLWNDILRCKDGSEYKFTSVQNTSSSAPKLRSEFKAIRWDYSEPFPIGKTCYLDSTIRMDVDGIVKSQQVESKPFDIN